MNINNLNPETFILIMPVYNDEDNIEKTINMWIPKVKKIVGSEILVVNDGSSDQTLNILEKFKNKISQFSVINKSNGGHGSAIIAGYTEAVNSKHDWVFQVDSNGQIPSYNFDKLWSNRINSDFILGFRFKRSDAKYRIIISWSSTILIYLLFGKIIKDPNIPYRLMRREYLKTLLPKVPRNIFIPNILLSILAMKNGQNLFNIPVNHEFRVKKYKSKQIILKWIPRSLMDLLRFMFDQQYDK